MSHKKDFVVTAEWNFYAASHWKGTTCMNFDAVSSGNDINLSFLVMNTT
jgi:hypothetical protein